MLGALLGLWRQGKDKSAALMARHQINRLLEAYGEMLRLNIDSKSKAIEVEVLLKGETHPIIISVEEYAVEEDLAGLSIHVKRISTSREWLTEAAHQFVQGKKFPVPPQYARLLKLLI